MYGAAKYPAPPESLPLERAGREEIEALQTEAFHRLVQRAWHHNSFYRKKWEAAGIKREMIRNIKDISLLPLVTKQELEQNLREFPPFGEFQGNLPSVRIQGSSGSSGKPKPFFHTARDWDNITSLWARRLAANGVGQGDLVQIAFTYALFIPGFTSTEGAMKLGAMVIPAGSGAVTSSQRQVEIAREWGSTVLGATGTYALHLADVAEEMGFDPARDFRFRLMYHTGEPLTEATRQKIQERWNCRSYNNYGSVETGAPTWECEEQAGMHINEDAYYFEVVDPRTGEALPDGEEGALVVTTLFKEAAPVIRYMIGDLAVIIPGTCKCGRTFRRLGTVKGRLDDMLKVKGAAVYPTAIETVLRRFPELGSEYRIIVECIEGLDNLRVEVEAVKYPPAPQLQGQVVQALKAQVGILCEVVLVPAGSLQGEVDNWIKSRRVIDKRKG